MKVITHEAIVEDGQIKLAEAVRLPERARIYVVVPGDEEANGFHVRGPRLARPADAVDFAKDFIEESPDAGL